MTITKEQLNLFVVCGKHYLNNSPKSKLWYAVDKILRKAIKLLKKVEDQRNEVRRDYALKKDKGVFDTKDNGEFQYTAESLSKVVAKMQEIDEEQIEVPTHIVSEYDDDPKVLSFDTRTSFEGIVIPVMEEKE